MRRTMRHVVTAVFAVALLLSLFCTINDDNGNPVNPGIPPGGGGGTLVGGGTDSTGGNTGGGTVTRVPAILADNGYAGVGDTVSIIVMLLSDTSRGAAVISGGSIKVSATRPDDWIRPSSVLTTDTNGQAILKFSSGTEGTAGIKLTYGSAAERNIAIEVTDNPPRNITISASPAVLPADGSSKSVITVQVKNNENNPIVGDVIKFSTNMGLITAEGTTDAEGKATAQLTSEQRNALATITATLKSDGSRSVKIAVEFSGVTITPSVSPETIKPNNVDTATVLAVLLDAAKNPIVGEKVTFVKEHAQTEFVKVDSTTDNRGEARCVIKSGAANGEWITVRAAGAEKSVRLTYSGQILKVERSGGVEYSGSHNRSEFTVTYTDGGGVPISGAKLRVTVTMGDSLTPIDDTAKVVFAKEFTSDASGKLVFSFNNPDFTGLATVYVKGETDKSSATASAQVNFLANGVESIKIVASPDVIGTNSGKSKITATVYDVFGNRVKDETISFNVIKGPGGGEYLEPPTATTAQDGTASTYLIAGTIPSVFKGVRVVASTYYRDGDKVVRRSDTISLTIAGPPKNITVRRNIENISAGTATYTLKLSALVSDINNNPVPDGTEVTFSSLVTAYRYFMLSPVFQDSGAPYRVDTIPVTVASEHFRDPRPYRPFPPFEDINKNGIPDKNPEPCNPKDSKVCVDLNGNNTQDEEKFYNTEEYNKLTAAEKANLYNNYEEVTVASGYKTIIPKGNPDFDIDWNRNGVADPSTAVIIKRTVLTKDGIADNELTYGQSDAWRIQVKIWAECQGLVTSSPEEFILPKGAGGNWNYFD